MSAVALETELRRDASVEVVVPVYNEAAALERSIQCLHQYLSASLPFSWKIVIADNASTDATWSIAARLAGRLDGVRAIHLNAKGRGRALRAAWSASDADVLCYMDVDLSTDLRALLPLVAGLVSGHAEVAIGSRLTAGSRVTRSRKRELISRAYNRLLRAVLRARFSDAQCGFKAVRADVAPALLDQVSDEGWFFDTELLMAAQRAGLRIHEVPVDWTEDPDSRVDISSTAVEDLRGVARLALQSPLIRFLAIGLTSTLAYALLYLMLRLGLSGSVANALALALTAVANTQANRRYTFGIRGWSGVLRHQAGGLMVFALALGLTEGALATLQAVVPHPSTLLEVAVLVAASALATMSRYVALRTWVFTRRDRGPANGASVIGERYVWT
jgi:glycosyltransferase involved in cell wall biosynthesis